MQLATQIGINSATTPLGGSAPPPIAIGQQQQPQPKGPQSAPVQTRDYAALHLEVFELLCTFHRVKRIQSKDTTQCGQLVQDLGLSNEQRAELINRSMYKILNEVEAKIIILPGTSGPTTPDYFDEWSFLTWALLLIINRLEALEPPEAALLDYGGKHFQEKIHTALVDLVNKAHRMQPPPTVQQNDQQFERFYQAYVTALISLHELYTMTQQNAGLYNEFEAHVAHFKKQLVACFVLQRDFANFHGSKLWRLLREQQIHKMTHYGYENKHFLDSAVSFYAHMLYNLGVLAARIQGFSFEIRSNKAWTASSTGNARPDLVKPLLSMVYQMADVLLSDSIICLEPSQNPILVTNNLFPMKIVSLCRFSFFRDFSLQIVSEEVAQQIQQEMRHRKMFDPPSPIRKTQTAALLAMKPATGVKRNNAKASDEGGNTAHKKSDVNSKEWISIPPLYDVDHGGWCATYPHLLCTTRQKDTLLETRSAMQTGKRPLFYFHVRAEMFSFSGGFNTAHTLSLPFTIATRRNQDCQVQRMMSSYTATCFWLYGTNVLDGLLIQWFDGEIEWKHFKLLYALYFAMNAEVMRTFTDEDFSILQQKMHCPECTEGGIWMQSITANCQPSAAMRITFKNVLCPHLHFSAAKCDLRFSVWRGMLELLHLFNDQKTETRNLWEAGLLQGFLELKIVHSMLRTLPGSGLVMRLSLVAGACVCITVKCFNGELLDLEPLDVKRLQAKNLHDYLKDIILAEKVDFVLDSNKEWLHVAEVMKRCQRCSSPTDQQAHTPPKTREVLSNALHPGPVDKEHKIAFTTMRVAVVTCKSSMVDANNEPDDEFGEHSAKPEAQRSEGIFEEKLEELLRNHGKTPEQAIDALSRLIMARATNQPSQEGLAIASGAIQMQQMSAAYDAQNSVDCSNSNPNPTPAFSMALGSHLEDSYPNSAHTQQQQQHPQISPAASINASPRSSSTQQQQQQQQLQNQNFYFGNFANSSNNNPNPLPTMNMPIVVMPSNVAQATQPFMLFPAPSAKDGQQHIGSAATIMAIGSLGGPASANEGANAMPAPFAMASTSSSNSYLQSTALHIGRFHPDTGSIGSMFSAPASSSISYVATQVHAQPPSSADSIQAQQQQPTEDQRFEQQKM